MITRYWRQHGYAWTEISREEFTRAVEDAGLRHGAGFYYINGIAYRLEHEHGQDLRPGRTRRGPR